MLLIDVFVFRIDGPWESWAPRVARDPWGSGIVRGRLGLRALSEGDDETSTVVVLGSSRALRIDTDALEAASGTPTLVLSMAHPGMRAYELSALIEELLPHPPDVAIVVASELETHRPLNVLVETAPGSLHSVFSLARLTGPRFVFEQRTIFLRLAAASLLDTYRFRSLLKDAGAVRLISFRDLSEERQRVRDSNPNLIVGHDPYDIDVEAEILRIADRFPSYTANSLRMQINTTRSVTSGAHVPVQMGLLRQALARLRNAGVEVIVVEPPLHPLTTQYFDNAAKESFRAYARKLERELGLRFIPSDPVLASDPAFFVDLVHLSHEGIPAFTEPIAAALAEVLSRVHTDQR